jgi:hypothetical protein
MPPRIRTPTSFLAFMTRKAINCSKPIAEPIE